MFGRATEDHPSASKLEVFQWYRIAPEVLMDSPEDLIDYSQSAQDSMIRRIDALSHPKVDDEDPKAISLRDMIDEKDSPGHPLLFIL